VISWLVSTRQNLLDDSAKKVMVVPEMECKQLLTNKSYLKPSWAFEHSDPLENLPGSHSHSLLVSDSEFVGIHE